MRSCALALALLLIPGVASAQIDFERTDWHVFGAVGFDPPLSGNVSSAVSGALASLPLVLGNVSMSDVYGALTRFEFGAGYRLNDRAELIARLAFTSGGGSRALLGVTPGEPFVGEFESFSEKSFEFGYRYHLAIFGPFHPYVGGSAGFARLASVSATLTLPGASLAPINLPVIDASAAPVLAGGAGLLIPLSTRVALMVDANLRWRGAFNSANVLVGTGLDTIGDGSARWAFPVVFGAVVNLGPGRVE